MIALGIAKAAVLAGLVRRKLTFFTWNVTNSCNEECPMCEVIRRPAVDLTIDEFRCAHRARLGDCLRIGQSRFDSGCCCRLRDL